MKVTLLSLVLLVAGGGSYAVGPTGWFLNGDKPSYYQFGTDSQTVYKGQSSLYLKSKDETIIGFGNMMRRVSADEYRGRKIRFSAWIKSSAVKQFTGLWMRVNQNTKELGFANMDGRWIKDTSDWGNFEILLDIPQDATVISFGVLLQGSGSVWVNAPKLEIVADLTSESRNSPSQPESSKHSADDPAVVKWFQENAVVLRTVQAGNGFSDMEPLKKVIGDARVVALGEATHGAREFFQFKHRMLEFLATEMGFNIFAIEANMPEAYRLNNYVLTGEGDPKKLLKGMYFWTWNTEEVLDMIEWMRAFNKSGKGRVQFTGFDMQTPNVACRTSATSFVNMIQLFQI